MHNVQANDPLHLPQPFGAFATRATMIPSADEITLVTAVKETSTDDDAKDDECVDDAGSLIFEKKSGVSNHEHFCT